MEKESKAMGKMKELWIDMHNGEMMTKDQQAFVEREARRSGMKIVEELFKTRKELQEWKDDYKAIDKFASDLEKYLNRVEDRDIKVRKFCEKRLEEEKKHYLRIKKEHPNSHVGRKKLAYCVGYRDAIRNVLELFNKDKVLLSIKK